MNTIYLTISSILISFFLIHFPTASFAIDKGGCMTCHRYPGFVKLIKPDSFKVMHIDEEKQLASKHGSTDCKQCHPNTVKIPHTDVTEVACTVKCHAEDKELIDDIEASYYVNFHKEERFAITRLDDGTSCRVCHPLYPHSVNNKVRAFTNMHTGFMLCEVCHLKKDGLDDLIYAWKDPEEFEFTGEPYGTHKEEEINEAEKPAKDKSFISKMLHIFSEEDGGDNDEETKKTRNIISRIAVFKIGENGTVLYVNTTDNNKAREHLKVEKDLSANEKQEQLDYFHRDIAKKEISIACGECHSPEGILDFNKLGFSKHKANDLEYLNIKGMVTKYKTFYLPNLFGH